MTTLTEFLLARIAEDEDAAMMSPMRTWEAHIPGTFEPIQIIHKRRDVVAADVEENAARHIARWTPARVLPECEAKRGIVELHQPYDIPQNMRWGSILACGMCGSVDDSPEEWPCESVKALAHVYADHPDFDPAWAL